MIKKRTSRLQYLFKRPAFLIGLVVLALAGLLLALELTNTTYIFHRHKIPAVIPTTPVSNTTDENKPPSSNTTVPTSSTKDSSSGGSTPTTSATLLAPYGNFVSNHRPTESLAEVSVCNSTPGASCDIRFTNGQTTTQLQTQTVGSDGSTSWKWNINNDAHLTSGEWQVTAVATLNGQSKTTDDPLKLIVQ